MSYHRFKVYILFFSQEESPSYTLSDLAPGVGGYLGLFIGWSLYGGLGDLGDLVLRLWGFLQVWAGRANNMI